MTLIEVFKSILNDEYNDDAKIAVRYNGKKYSANFLCYAETTLDDVTLNPTLALVVMSNNDLPPQSCGGMIEFFANDNDTLFNIPDDDYRCFICGIGESADVDVSLYFEFDEIIIEIG